MFINQPNTQNPAPTTTQPRRHPNDFDVLTGPGPEDTEEDQNESGGWKDGMLS